jgi:hypothetical protein
MRIASAIYSSAQKATPCGERRQSRKLSSILQPSYLRLIAQESNAPAVKPAANVVATISIG